MEETQNLKLLLYEMDRTITIMTGDSPYYEESDDPEKIKALISKFAKVIMEQSDDLCVRGLAGSIFDTLTIDEIREQLEDINNTTLARESEAM
jgi:hypothetical protein